MNVLDDDCLLLIFRQLPLHERANTRLVSKRFRRLVDLIQIKKLVVYIGNEPLSGKLAFTSEPYHLADTAYVSDPQKFFASPIIRNQLNGVQTLVIHGRRFNKFDKFKIAIKFEKLRHLEMRNFFLDDNTILQSASLECLMLHDCFATNAFRSLAPQKIAEGSFQALGFGDLRSKSVKRLALYGLYESAFYILLHKKQLCNSLQEINIIAMDFDALVYLNKHCKSLKAIDIIIPRMLESARLPQVATKAKLQKIANDFRADLSVYLYGVLWNKTTCTSVYWFLQTFADSVFYNVPERKLEFCPLRKLACDARSVVNGLAPDLTRFRELVKILDLIEGPEDGLADLMVGLLKPAQRKIDSEAYMCFTNCEEIFFDPCSDCGDFKKYLTFWPNLKAMTLVSQFDQAYGNDVLDLIGEKCASLEKLSIQHWSPRKPNFAFLLKLRRLMKLKLMLGCPIDQCEGFDLLALLTKLRFIEQFDACLLSPKHLNKAELAAFEKRVNATLTSEKLKSKKLAFAIRLHTVKKNRQFVNYALGSENREETNSVDEEDHNTMEQLIEYLARPKYVI